MLGTRQLTVGSHRVFSLYFSWFTNILQNIFFCVQQNKETHTCLEQLEGKL